MKLRLRLAALAIAFLIPGLVLARWLGGGGMAATPISLPAFSEAVGPWELTADMRMPDDHVDSRLMRHAGNRTFYGTRLH